MKKYRVVEFMGGGYGIQYKRWFWWKTLPFEPISYPNGAYSHIKELQLKENEQMKRKKDLKIKAIHGYSFS